MLHDQGQDLEAASTVEKCLQGIGRAKMDANGKPGNRDLEGSSLADALLTSPATGKRRTTGRKQRECLDKALEVNPTDIDVLIACYRLPDQTPEYHAKIVDLIQRAAAEFARDLPRSPTTSRPATTMPG